MIQKRSKTCKLGILMWITHLIYSNTCTNVAKHFHDISYNPFKDGLGICLSINPSLIRALV